MLRNKYGMYKTDNVFAKMRAKSTRTVSMNDAIAEHVGDRAFALKQSFSEAVNQLLQIALNALVGAKYDERWRPGPYPGHEWELARRERIAREEQERYDNAVDANVAYSVTPAELAEYVRSRKQRESAKAKHNGHM